MADDFFFEIDIRDDQAEAIARGLYAVAKADGDIHPREAAMITEFFGGTADHASHLASLDRQAAIEPATLAAILGSKDVRTLFVKTALLVAYVDGNYAPAEAKAVSAYATACGIDAKAVAQLEASVKDYLLGHLSHIHNVEAVAAVAKELKR